MATSGVMNYSTSTKEIVTEALELLGVLGEGEVYTPDQYTSVARTLNMLIKNWQAAGLNLFAVQRNVLFLKKGQEEYTLSSASTDHYALENSIINHKVSTAAAAAATSIVLDSVTSLVPTMHIGIQLSSNTDMFWTTIVSVVGTTVNLLGALPSDVASGAHVYAYSTTQNRPMRVLEGYYRRNDSPNTIDIPMGMLSRVDYWQLTTKTTQAQPLQMYFDPQRTDAKLRIWPVADNEANFLILLCQRTLDDFASATNEPDYPQEWFLPLAYNLAVMIAPKYGIPAQDYQRVQLSAATLYQAAAGWDAEQQTSVYFKPDTWGSDIGRRGN